MYTGIVGLLLGVIGLAALLFPVNLDQYDSYGVKVTCDNGFSSDLTQARQATGDALVTRCVTGFLVVWVQNDQQQEQVA
jgi:hypothetical protein